MKKYYYPAILITIGLIISVATPLAAKAVFIGGSCNSDSDCDGAAVCTANKCVYSSTVYNQIKANNPDFKSSAQHTVVSSPALTFTPQAPIPNTDISGTVAVDGSLIAKYTGALYTYALDIVGVLAVIMLMIAGLIWLTSRGDSNQISKAKKMLSGSLIGLFLLLGANILLRTINPDLINLKPIPGITNISQVNINLVCCQYKNSNGATVVINTTSDDCKTLKGTAKQNTTVVNNSCQNMGCSIYLNNYDNGIFLVKSCRDTFEESFQFEEANRKDDRHENFVFNSLPCNQLDYCFSKTGGSLNINNLCANKNNGDFVKLTTGQWLDYYCYNGILYTGAGTKGEPCGGGEEGNGSTCHTECIYNNFLAGRDCGPGLYCCYAGQIKTD